MLVAIQNRRCISLRSLRIVAIALIASLAGAVHPLSAQDHKVPQVLIVTSGQWFLRPFFSAEMKSSVGALMPNESHLVLDTKAAYASTWYELDVPPLGHVWVVSTKNDEGKRALTRAAGYADLSKGIKLEARREGNSANLVVDVEESSAAASVLPIGVYSIGRNPPYPPNKLGEIKNVGNTPILIPPDIANLQKFGVVLTSPKGLSSRMDVVFVIVIGAILFWVRRTHRRKNEPANGANDTRKLGDAAAQSDNEPQLGTALQRRSAQASTHGPETDERRALDMRLQELKSKGEITNSALTNLQTEVAGSKAEIARALGEIRTKVDALLKVDPLSADKRYNGLSGAIERAVAGIRAEMYQSLGPLSSGIGELRTFYSEERTMLQSNVQTLTQERDLFRGHLVFISSEARGTLERIIVNLEEFIAATDSLQSAFRSIAARTLGRFLLVRSITEAYVGSFSLGGPRLYLLELGTFMTEGRSSLPELVRCTQGGRTLSGDEIAKAMSRILHDSCISGNFDLLLAGVERFRHLRMIVPFTSPDESAHLEAVAAVGEHVTRAKVALRELRIVPIELPFLSRVTNELAPYLQFVESKVAVETYYPEWLPNGTQHREVVLDCRRWAYLDECGKLWHNQRAHIVVSV